MDYRSVRSIYCGKFSLEKLIFFHEKESFMASFSNNDKRAVFHENAARMLKKIKAEGDLNG